MSTLTYEGDLVRSPSAVRALLADRAFLEHWTSLHRLLDHDIRIDGHETCLRWVLPADGIPSFARGRVGDTIPVTLRFRWDGGSAERIDGELDVDLEGRTTGTLRAAVALRALGTAPETTRMSIDGEFQIQAGPFSGPAARLAKRHILMPVLADELYPQLNAWSGS